MRVVDFDQQGVQVRRLGRPWLDGRDGAAQHHLAIRSRFAAGLQQFARAIQHARLDLDVGGGAGDFRHKGETAVTVSRLVQRRRHGVIAQTGLRFGIQINAALDAGQAPEILILKVGTIGPAIHFDRDGVFTGADKLVQFELRRQLGILRIADPPAIHPNIISRAGRADLQEHVALLPAGRQVEVAPVGADLVQFVRNEWLVGWKRVDDVGENRLAIALRLYHAGHLDAAPLADVVGGLEEVLRPRFGRRRISEGPGSIQ